MSVENPEFAEARAASLTCFEIAALGGCPFCWGKGKWLGISDSDWKALGPRAQPRTVMSCGACRGTGRAPKSLQR